MKLSSRALAPLLGEAEIAALIHATDRSRPVLSQHPPQRGRSGRLVGRGIDSGSEIAELRPYQPGDNPRHIDWRATARSRVPLTRTYHPELERPLCLLIDRSASMRFGTRARIKAAQALRWALWLAAPALREGREIAALLLDSPPHWLPPQRGMAAIGNLLDHANRPCPPIPADGDDTWTPALALLRQRLPAGSELILISDFNTLGGEHDMALRRLGGHCDARVLHISDPLEHRLPAIPAPLQLSWGRRHRVVPASGPAREALNRQLARAREQLTQRFFLAGMDYQAVATDQQDFSHLGEGA